MRGTNQEFAATQRRPGARPTAGSGRARRFARLQVEPLESRVVPTTIVLPPSKDNTLFQSAAGTISDGAGSYFFAGETKGGLIRRGVIAFDIAGNIPAGATINSVTLQLHMSQTKAGAKTVQLARLLADWGEGTSNSDSNPGQGAPATTNDATWIYRFFNTTATWKNPGGEFATNASAFVSVGGFGFYTWGSTSQMVADVQGWLNNPSSNFGWIVRGDEAQSTTAKRFDSKENAVVADRPMLTINYTSSTFVPITISGQKFNDLNGNGVKDPGEPGLAGWTIFLDLNNNGQPDPGEPTTTTDANGNYSFANFGPGTYYVREVGQPSWQQTTPNPPDIVAQSGTDVPNVNFGNFKQITISGQVFNDLNDNGNKDPGEPGLAGWTVFLDTNNNGQPDPGEPTTTTDADGNYSFANLGPGTYYVREVVQDTWQQTTPNPADIVAQSGTDVPGQDFGNFQSPGFSPIRTRGRIPPGAGDQLAAVLGPALVSRPAAPVAPTAGAVPAPAPMPPADRATVDRLLASLKAAEPPSGLSLYGHSRELLDPGWAGLVLAEDVVLTGAFQPGFRE